MRVVMAKARVPRRRDHFVQHAVGFDADAEFVFKRLEVQVAGVVADGHQQDHVQQFSHRLAVGHRFDAGQIQRAFAAQRVGGLFQLCIVFHIGDEAFDAFGAGGVELIQRPLHVALGGDHGFDVVAQQRAELIANGELLRIAHGDGQRVVFKLDGNHAVQLRHRLGNSGQHVGGNFQFAKSDNPHAHLLGERLGQLLFGDVAQRFGNLAQQFARPALLLFQQQLELILRNHPQVDKNLTDATNGHAKDFWVGSSEF